MFGFNNKITSLVFVLMISLSSCSSLFTVSTNATIKANEHDTKLEVYDEATESYTYIGDGEVEYRLNNHKDYYLIRGSKKGRRTRTKPIARSKFNALKLLDMAIPLIADGILIYSFSSTSGDGNSLTGPAWIVGTLGWLGMAVSPWKKFDKVYEFPPLEPLPIKDEEIGAVSVNRVGIDINGFGEKYYDSFSHFQKGKSNYERNYKDKLDESNTDFNKGMNYLLEKWSFRDSTKSLLSPFYASYKLSCDITKITEHRIGQMVSAEVYTKWKIYQPHSKEPIFEQDFTTFSNWTPYNVENRFLDAHVSALENNLLDVLSDENFREKLKKDDLVGSPVSNENLESIMLNPELPFVSNIQEAVKAVVTIKTKQGHGSGCIVSRDGYVITNYHVINEVDSSSTITVMLNDGRELDGKIVRVSPAYDLAIVKINATINKPFYIQSKLSAELGKEVYAIGTPSDIELGQTISKGIISGKRKFDEKVYVQTDVSINGGNSGGALIDKEGNLIGIVNAKIVGFGVEGLGFAIPGHYILDELKLSYKKSPKN